MKRAPAAGRAPAAPPAATQPGSPAASQSTAIEVHFGTRTRLAARLDVTPAGLLAIGGMVSMILLSSAAIVRAARGRRS